MGLSAGTGFLRRKNQSTSQTRPAIKILACSALAASLVAFLWGVWWWVSRLHTSSSSTRKWHSNVLREASFNTWAADSEARMSAASSLSPSEILLRPCHGESMLAPASGRSDWLRGFRQEVVHCSWDRMVPFFYGFALHQCMRTVEMDCETGPIRNKVRVRLYTTSGMPDMPCRNFSDRHIRN